MFVRRAAIRTAIGMALLFFVGLVQAQVINSVSFVPANPKPGQSVTAHLIGESLCAASSPVRAGSVVTLTLLQPCASTFDLDANIGSFAAGTYSFAIQVCTDAVPPPPASPCSVTTLGSFVVADIGTASAPALSPTGFASIVFSLLASAFIALRPRASTRRHRIPAGATLRRRPRRPRSRD